MSGAHLAFATFLGVALSLPGCAATPARPTFDDLQVIARGQDSGGEFCSDFALTVAQARTFFAKSAAVDAMTLHDRYDLLPCWVRGTARDARENRNVEDTDGNDCVDRARSENGGNHDCR